MEAETVISLVLGTALAIFSVVLVGYSFLRGQAAVTQPLSNDSSDDSTGHARYIPTGNDDPALADIFDAIRTLELENSLGRMHEKDFQEQFQAYRIQAATVLRNQLEAGLGDPTWVLEQEILLARDAQENPNRITTPCPNCSAAVSRSSDDCPHCGADMERRP
ncbi:MAG: hypothetical protein O3A93_05485 [Chloroflexi bacterium]|nr:hypothetical protein [Chloroflexota bacterium]MDA1270695.1 hypothetical protein [Chloroflexota bacterium]PKB59555.1 MAG: hypothetical protein BZY83_01200 [SAR202 cluster bacterium Casp-Chloro-G2]